MNRSLTTFSILALAAIGCAEPTVDRADPATSEPRSDDTKGTSTSPESVEYPAELDSLHASHFSTAFDRSLCEIFDRSKIAGRFSVERIVSDLGSDPWGRNPNTIPVTTITLVTDEAWRGNLGKSVEIRTPGGINPDGSIMSADADFERSESVLVFPEHQFDDGTWAVRPELVFHQKEDGGYTNGRVLGLGTYTAADIWSRLQATPCNDVQPDAVLRAQQPAAPREDEEEHPVDPVVVED